MLTLWDFSSHFPWRTISKCFEKIVISVVFFTRLILMTYIKDTSKMSKFQNREKLDKNISGLSVSVCEIVVTFSYQNLLVSIGFDRP